MNKRAYFHDYWGQGWPDLGYLEPYFVAPAGQEWFTAPETTGQC